MDWTTRLDYYTHENCLWMKNQQDCKVETLRVQPCITQFMLQSQTVSKLLLFAEYLHGCETWVIKHTLISVLMSMVPFMWPSSYCSVWPVTKTVQLLAVRNCVHSFVRPVSILQLSLHEFCNLQGYMTRIFTDLFILHSEAISVSPVVQSSNTVHWIVTAVTNNRVFLINELPVHFH